MVAQILLVGLDGGSVFAVGVQGAGYAQLQRGVGVAVAQRVLIGRRGAGKLIELLVALAHAEGHAAAQGALLALGELVVNLAVGLRRVEIFATRQLFVGGGELGAAAAAESQRRGRYHAKQKSLSHINCITDSDAVYFNLQSYAKKRRWARENKKAPILRESALLF